MVIAITPGDIWEWIHESDLEREEEAQTVFVCRTLTAAQDRWAQNKYARSTPAKKGFRKYKGDDRPGVEFRAGDYGHAAILAGLVDVKRLKDKKGNPIEFETRRAMIADENEDVPTESFLGRIHSEVRIDLGNAIIARGAPEELDRKN